MGVKSRLRRKVEFIANRKAVLNVYISLDKKPERTQEETAQLKEANNFLKVLNWSLSLKPKCVDTVE